MIVGHGNMQNMGGMQGHFVSDIAIIIFPCYYYYSSSSNNKITLVVVVVVVVVVMVVVTALHIYP